MEESISLAAAPPGESEAEAQVSGAKAPAKYSSLFKMGLFFAVPDCLFACFCCQSDTILHSK